jgi:integrase
LASERYISEKSNILSPSTIKGYESVLRSLSERFRNNNISDITSLEVQSEINTYAKTHSPKSTRNVHGFISSVLGMFCPNTVLNTTLPQKEVKKPYIPSDEDVKRILEQAKGSQFEIALILAMFGWRRSEICALTLDDLDGNILTIEKAKVQSVENEWITKTTKTEAGTRSIYLPDHVVELIKERGVIYNGHPNSILIYLQRTQRNLGIPKFSLHKLRHYFASSAHARGIPDQYIMDAGGWKSKYVLGNVYQHAMEDKKKEMQQKTAKFYSEEILS